MLCALFGMQIDFGSAERFYQFENAVVLVEA
jgi:hypothetical protein